MFSSQPHFVTIEGIVSTKNSVPPPPNASLTVELDDVTGGDGQYQPMAQVQLNHPTHWPVNYSLSYDSAVVIPGHKYSIAATIFVGEKAVYQVPAGLVIYTGAVPTHVDFVLEPVGKGP
jgi:uncharacterized lipoprotein YbaY